MASISLSLRRRLWVRCFDVQHVEHATPLYPKHSASLIAERFIQNGNMMRNKLFFAAFASIFAGTAAHAQSSVTLYGLIDEGFNYTTNSGGHSGYQMLSGDVAGSRWGLKGNEDLGNGLSAVFKLENGFNLNTGAFGENGQEFGRQAYVGLASTHYGTLTFGRQYGPNVDLWSGFTAAGATIGDFASHPFDNDNADYDYRLNNSVKYVSPTYGGFTGEALYGFSNQAGGFANNRVYSAAGSYASGPFSAAVAYQRMDSANGTTSGAVAGDGIFSAHSQQDIDAGVKWTFGNKSNIALAYSHVTANAPTANAYVDVGDQTWSSWKFDNVELNAQYYFRSDVWLAGEYTFTHAELKTPSGSSAPNWHQVALMLNYDFSKSTSVYLQGAWQHATGSTGTEFDDADVVGASGVSGGRNQMVYRLGMLHTF